MFAAAFFPPEWAGTVVFGVYALGIVFGIVFAKIFRKYLFAGEAEPFVMELPPYHLPTLKATLTHMFERGIMYLKKQVLHPCCFHPRMVHHNISNGCGILQRL